AADLVDQQMAEPVAAELGIEPRFEQVVDAVLFEREVEGFALAADGEEVERQAIERGERAGERGVTGRERGVAGDGGAGGALPAGGLEAEAVVERGAQDGAIAAVDALERQ